MTNQHLRSRWAAIGAAIAVTLGAGGIGITHATTSSGERPVYLPIEPCRLSDTRADFQVGPRDTPLGGGETYTLDGWGAVGDCNLPSDTAGLALNVTAVGATAATFLTFFPAGITLPEASNLNPAPGQPPIPNAVNVALNPGGEFSVYNLAGSVYAIIDVVGIYDHHTHDDRYYTQDEVDALVATQAGEPLITELFYADEDIETSPLTSFELIRTVGDFTKQSPSTDIRLDWYGHHSFVGTEGTSFCHYELRIDGRRTNGNADDFAQYGTGGDAVSYTADSPITTFARFEGLSPGVHTVEIYVRGQATSCTLNKGNFDQVVMVTEFAAG